MLFRYIADDSAEVECDTLRANVTDDFPSQQEDVTAAESTREVDEVDAADVSEMTENHPCTQTTTVDTSMPSPAPTVQTVRSSSAGRPSRATKFIDRRTETLISACATISTSTADNADVTRYTSDVVDKCESHKVVTSPVLRGTKFRDRKFDVSSLHDCRQLGLTVHRSMLTSVPATTATTTVNVVRAPSSSTVLQSDWPHKDTSVAVTCSPTVPIVSPSTAASRLTVTLAESTSQQSHRNCRLITGRAAVPSTKPLAVTGSGSESVNDDVSSRPAADQSPITSNQPRLRSLSSSGRSLADGDAESSKSTRPRSTVCLLSQLSPVTVQPSMSTSSDRQIPTTTLISSTAAADVTSTTMVISRRAVFELVSSPLPIPTVSTAASEPLSPVRARCLSASTPSRHPATEPSPSRHELGPGAKTPVTEGVSVMTALDDALAILTSVVTETCQPQNCHTHLASTNLPNARDVIAPLVAQATCKSPCIGQSHSCTLYSIRYTLRHSASIKTTTLVAVCYCRVPLTALES